MTAQHPPPRDLDAVWRWCSDLIDNTTGELPLIGTAAWTAADQNVKVASLARYAVAALSLEEPHMVAYRLAVEATFGHAEDRAYRQLVRDIGHDVAGRTDWARVARNHITYDEISRRRNRPPTGPDRSAHG